MALLFGECTGTDEEEEEDPAVQNAFLLQEQGIIGWNCDEVGLKLWLKRVPAQDFLLQSVDTDSLSFYLSPMIVLKVCSFLFSHMIS